jgi:hypothetical protein
VVELDPFEEGGVVVEVPISLRVGTFGDCEEGGSLRSRVVICKESLRGSGKIAKSRGICSWKEEWRRGRSVELVMWWSRERLSATWFSLPGNHFEKRTEEWKEELPRVNVPPEDGLYFRGRGFGEELWDGEDVVAFDWVGEIGRPAEEVENEWEDLAAVKDVTVQIAVEEVVDVDLGLRVVVDWKRDGEMVEGSMIAVAGSLAKCGEKCCCGSQPGFRTKSLERSQASSLRSLQRLGLGAPPNVNQRATRRKEPTRTIAETAVEGALWSRR